MLQAEEIKLNWEHYRRRVNELFPTRADKLNKMYDDYEERIVMMPASSIAHFHNAFACDDLHTNTLYYLFHLNHFLKVEQHDELLSICDHFPLQKNFLEFYLEPYIFDIHPENDL